MNTKYMIILTLVASAHVHGAAQKSNTLGKRKRQEEEKQNTQNKRQKTDQQMGASINTLSGQGAREDEGPDHSGNEDSYMPWREICQRCDSRHAESNVYSGEEVKADRTARKAYPKHTANQGLGSNFRRFAPEGLPQDQLLQRMDCEPRGPGVKDKNNDESHPHNNCASTLGKRTRQAEETDKNTQKKRQKTTNQAATDKPDQEMKQESNALPESGDQQIIEQIDTSTQNYAGTTRGHPIQAQNNQVNTQHGPFITCLPAGPMHTMMQYLELNEAAQLRGVSQSTCNQISAYPQGIPQKYCEQTGEWVVWGQNDNTDNCFLYFLSTLHVPNQPNALQILQTICQNQNGNNGKKVEHIVIALSDPHTDEWAQIITPEDARIINDLFERCHNGRVTLKCPQTPWKIDAPTMDALSKVKYLTFLMSDQTRTQLLPQRYCDQKGEWVVWGQNDNTDDCFRCFVSTLYVPNRPNALQTLQTIGLDKEVEHIVIDVSDPGTDDLTPIITPEDARIINNLFGQCQQGRLTFKCPQANWEIDDLTMRNLSKVKHLTFEGKTGNEEINVELADNIENKSVTMRNAFICKLIQNDHRILTEGLGAQLSLKDGTITAQSDNKTWISTYDEDGNIHSQTTSEGLNSQISLKDGTITAQSDNKTWIKTIHSEATAEGLNAQITVDENGIITATSNECVCHKEYTEDKKLCQMTISAGPNAQITATEGGFITATSNKRVFHKEYTEDENIHSQTTAEGPNAQITVTEGDFITATSNKRIFHKEYTEDEKLCQRTKAYGPNAKLTVTEDGVMMATSNKIVFRDEYTEDEKLCQRTKAYGPDAQINVDENGIITLKSNDQVMHYKCNGPLTTKAYGPDAQITIIKNVIMQITGQDLVHETRDDEGYYCKLAPAKGTQGTATFTKATMDIIGQNLFYQKHNKENVLLYSVETDGPNSKYTLYNFAKGIITIMGDNQVVHAKRNEDGSGSLRTKAHGPNAKLTIRENGTINIIGQDLVHETYNKDGVLLSEFKNDGYNSYVTFEGGKRRQLIRAPQAQRGRDLEQGDHKQWPYPNHR